MNRAWFFARLRAMQLAKAAAEAERTCTNQLVGGLNRYASNESRTASTSNEPQVNQ